MNGRCRHHRLKIWLAAAALSIATPTFGQARLIDSGTASLGTVGFHWQTYLTPPTPPLASSFGTAHDQTQPNLVSRLLLDSAQRVYFGYTVQIEALPDAGTFRLTLQPLSLTPRLRQELGADASEWKALSTGRFAGPNTIRSGEVLELNLLSNDAWGQRVTEYVTVQEVRPRPDGFQRLGPVPREFTFAPGMTRDFTVSDASLRLREPRLFINGRLEPSSTRTSVSD